MKLIMYTKDKKILKIFLNEFKKLIDLKYP